MKVSTKKQSDRLTLISDKTNRKNSFQVNASAVRNSFHGWLHSVVPISAEHGHSTAAVYLVPKLSAADVSRVNQATIREGETHRIWPPSVLQQFHAAEVVTDSVEHYVLRDVNLTRVEPRKREANQRYSDNN